MGIFDRFRSAAQAADGGINNADTDEQDALRLIGEGNALEAQGRTDEAMQSYLDAIRLAPQLARAHLNHGNALLAKGDLKGALDAYRTAIGHKPDYAGAWYNMGNALLGSGQLNDAVASYRKALEIKADYAEVHCALGVALKELGQLDDAVASFKRALALNPDLVEAQNNLGIAVNDLYNRGNELASLGQLESAVASYRQVLQIKPDFAGAQCNLGLALQELGQFQEAVSRLRRALQIDPDLAEAHCNLGVALRDMGDIEGAVASYRRAVELAPGFAEAHNNLGFALQELGQFQEAMAGFRRALEIKPDFAGAHCNLANVLKDLGHLDDAEASYRRALAIRPDFAEAHSNLLLVMNYSAGRTVLSCLEQARRYGQIVAAKVGRRFTAWRCAADPQRLRVGLVSGDLRIHSVGHFLEGLLSHLDAARIELIAYPTHHKEDELTGRIRPYFSAWKPLVGKSDEAAANLIHADGVHILLDVSGHTAHNRLPVFAWKPAPVQVTWLGLPGTTGMNEMDYVLGDALAIRREHESHFAERVWRLPDSYVCFSVPPFPVNVTPLPALLAGHVTFGSFNNLAKMNDAVVELWAKVLLAVRDSRLYLKTAQLNDASICDRTLRRFAARGIAPERLLLGGNRISIADHLAEYNKVDIALDTFPYPGVTTSIESLWMGVPVLSLDGDRFLSLSAKSIAHHAGLPDWVAADSDDYVARAVAFTSNLQRLAELRGGLRQQVVASPLFDAPRFARNFEDALWGMWRTCQAERGKPA